MTPLERYRRDSEERVSTYRDNLQLRCAARSFFEQIGIGNANYVYNFTWLGIPILQIPQDLQAMQEIIWEVKPDLIVETGVAWGGSLMFSASMIAVMEACGEIENGRVLGIDVEIRPHNRQSIQSHPLSKKITLLEGSSTADDLVEQVHRVAEGHQRVMVCLDSNHTHSHVLQELETYVPIVTPGSYCVVGDTIIEDAPTSMLLRRPWGHGNSPKSAVHEYLHRLSAEGRTDRRGRMIAVEIDRQIEDKILLTGSPDGYLRRVA